MTEREPFAEVELISDGSGYSVRLTGVDGRTGVVEDYHRKELAENAVRKINAAFEAVVRERVREAVESFRERAAKAVMQTGSGLLASAYAAAIRALPVEEKR